MDNECEFRKILLDTKFKLSDDDKQNLMFIIGSDVAKNLENSELTKVFEALIQRNKLSSNDLNYLIVRLETIKRHDLAENLKRN
ncbi:unnamed protein product [Didymodactylos carnosus]|uniref:DED domain-containing protein n=1 Tax=Didymodactylos carnosus TaxID=1234261 RepID=A0A815CPW5_9BILA|nr:unnamed protein product [Didymodactylos carnosus]CAF4088223.1 unnamed protein product [Didymodactylos carnosus]